MVITTNENSVMSDHCSLKYDFLYDTCRYEVSNNLIKEKFNCTFALFANKHNNEPSSNECTILNVTCNGGKDSFHDMAKRDFKGKNSSQCTRACSYLDVSYGYPFTYEIKNDTAASVTMYFRTSVAIRESHLAYDSSSLVAEIGGFTGLLLGVSFFDFAKIVKLSFERIQVLTELFQTIVNKITRNP